MNSPFASSRPRRKPSVTHRKWRHFGHSSSLLLHELPAPPGKVDTSHHVFSIRWSGSQMGYLSPVSLVVQGLSTPRSKSRTKEPSLPLVSLLDGDALRNVTPTPQTLREHKDGYLHHLLHQGLVGAGLSALQPTDVLADPCDEGELGPLAHRIPGGETHEGKQSDVICTNSKRRAWGSVRTPRSTPSRHLKGTQSDTEGATVPSLDPNNSAAGGNAHFTDGRWRCRRAPGCSRGCTARGSPGLSGCHTHHPALPSDSHASNSESDSGSKRLSTVLSQIFEALFGTGKPHSRETGTKLGSEGREQRQWPCFWPGIQLGAPWAFLDCGQTGQ